MLLKIVVGGGGVYISCITAFYCNTNYQWKVVINQTIKIVTGEVVGREGYAESLLSIK
jgi:hypothetical protein